MIIIITYFFKRKKPTLQVLPLPDNEIMYSALSAAVVQNITTSFFWWMLFLGLPFESQHFNDVSEQHRAPFPRKFLVQYSLSRNGY